ncbi:hypothetical protein HOD29_05925 [archaeon]|jgi:hypothetical protein|nr:hypothetical protein [archaeon]
MKVGKKEIQKKVLEDLKNKEILVSSDLKKAISITYNLLIKELNHDLDFYEKTVVEKDGIIGELRKQQKSILRSILGVAHKIKTSQCYKCSIKGNSGYSKKYCNFDNCVAIRFEKELQKEVKEIGKRGANKRGG